jgi:hypothetical protein
MTLSSRANEQLPSKYARVSTTEASNFSNATRNRAVQKRVYLNRYGVFRKKLKRLFAPMTASTCGDVFVLSSKSVDAVPS